MLFEQHTSLNDALINAKFEVRNHYNVYFDCQFKGRSINQDAFSTVFLKEHYIDNRMINSKRWKPDETFINEANQTVCIIKKKLQSKNGSVDEKLATLPFKVSNTENYYNLQDITSFTYIYYLQNSLMHQHINPLIP